MSDIGITEKKSFDTQIFLFYVYRILSRFYLYLPIFVVYLVKLGISYFNIGVVIASYGIAVMITKPVVEFLKKKSRLKILILSGEIFKAAGILGLAVSGDHLVMLILSQFLIGTGFSLTAGTDSGILYRLVQDMGISDKYRELESKSQSFIFLAVLLSGILGSFLAEISITLPLYSTVPFNLIAGISVFFMIEAPIDKNESGKTDNNKKRVNKVLYKSFHVILYYSLNRAIIMTYFVLVLPLLLFVRTEINIGFFGLILSLFSLTAFLTGMLMNKYSKKFGEVALWVIAPTSLICGSYFLTKPSTEFFLFVPVLLGLAAGIVRPLSYNYLNKHAGEFRTQAVALAEFLFALLNVLFLILIASLFIYDINFSLYLISAVLLVMSLYQLFHHVYLMRIK